jgi:hypothetical protein
VRLLSSLISTTRFRKSSLSASTRAALWRPPGHPGVVPVNDIGRFGNRPVFTTELVKG